MGVEEGASDLAVASQEQRCGGWYRGAGMKTHQLNEGGGGGGESGK